MPTKKKKKIQQLKTQSNPKPPRKYYKPLERYYPAMSKLFFSGEVKEVRKLPEDTPFSLLVIAESRIIVAVYIQNFIRVGKKDIILAVGDVRVPSEALHGKCDLVVFAEQAEVIGWHYDNLSLLEEEIAMNVFEDDDFIDISDKIIDYSQLLEEGSENK